MDGATLKAMVVEAIRPGTVPGNGGSLAIQAPKRMRPRHRFVVQLAEQGYSNREIAQIVGYTEGRVSVILRWQDPEVKEAREEARRRQTDSIHDVGSRIKHAADEMVTRMIVLARQSENLGVARLAARDMLDRAGYSPVRRVIAANVNVPVDALLEAASRLEKMGDVPLQSEVHAVRTPDGR